MIDPIPFYNFKPSNVTFLTILSRFDRDLVDPIGESINDVFANYKVSRGTNYTLFDGRIKIMTRSTNQRNFVCAHYYSHSLYSNIALPEKGQCISDEIHYALMSISIVVVDLQRIIFFIAQ